MWWTLTSCTAGLWTHRQNKELVCPPRRFVVKQLVNCSLVYACRQSSSGKSPTTRCAGERVNGPRRVFDNSLGVLQLVELVISLQSPVSKKKTITGGMNICERTHKHAYPFSRFRRPGRGRTRASSRRPVQRRYAQTEKERSPQPSHRAHNCFRQGW